MDIYVSSPEYDRSFKEKKTWKKRCILTQKISYLINWSIILTIKEWIIK